MRDNIISFEEFTDVPKLKLNKYDIVFVDDDSYCTDLEEQLSHTKIKLKVILLDSNSTLNYDEEIFTHAIEKPFLPSQIRDIIHILPNIKPVNTTKILNVNEIDKIKSLLNEDENHSNIPEAIEENFKTNTHSKKSKRKKSKKKKEDLFTLEEKILATLKDMKIKKIKKLLKGAEINISIKFKDSK
jgi:hypothetical protein